MPARISIDGQSRALLRMALSAAIRSRENDAVVCALIRAARLSLDKANQRGHFWASGLQSDLFYSENMDCAPLECRRNVIRWLHHLNSQIGAKRFIEDPVPLGQEIRDQIMQAIREAAERRIAEQNKKAA